MKKEEIRQCEANGHTCGTHEPYEKEIWAGGVLCAGCGRTRPNVKYVLQTVINSEEQFYKQWTNHHPYKEEVDKEDELWDEVMQEMGFYSSQLDNIKSKFILTRKV